MEHRVSYTVIGAFVLVLGGMLVAGLLWLAAGGATTRYTTYALYLKSGAASLNRDSPVLYHGVAVGRVAEITLDPDNPTQARVLLDIRQGVPIKADTRATVDTRGVTGSGFVNLSGGASDSPQLTAKPGQPYPVIPAQQNGIESLTAAAQQVARRIVEISARLQRILSDKNINAISQSLQNIRAVTAGLARRTKQLDSAIDHLNGTLANAQTASARLPALIDQVHATVVSIRSVANKVGGAASGVDKTTTKLRELTPQAAHLLQQLAQASDNLNALLQQLEQQPSVLISGKPQRPGPGERGTGGSGGQ